MRRSAIALAALALAVAAPAVAQTLQVPIDQTTTISLPAAARDVVIGNPTMIDVDLLDARNAVVMGKAYGVTSLQVFDDHGRSIYARQVVVSAADNNRLSVYRGANVYNYACSPRCERTAMPGELNTDYSNYAGSYKDYGDRQRSAADTGNK
jgi:hypothetical protein